MEYRKHELEKYKCLWITEDSYKLVRKEKTKQKKSLMRIIDDLIQEKYGRGDTAENKDGLHGTENDSPIPKYQDYGS